MYKRQAAGYQVILIETVGVGQSEVTVKSMVDFMLLLMLAGSGDHLQGIKKGIIEMADGLAITKADGSNKVRAQATQSEFSSALHMLQPATGKNVPVMLTSALEGMGIGDCWKMIEDHHAHEISLGYFQANRSRQNLAWFRENLNLGIRQLAQESASIHSLITDLEEKVFANKVLPSTASRKVIEALATRIQHS